MPNSVQHVPYLQFRLLFYSNPLLNIPFHIHPLSPKITPPPPPFLSHLYSIPTTPSTLLQTPSPLLHTHDMYKLSAVTPPHDLLQTCGGRKSVCPFWIRSTYNLLSHLRTSFRVNELWSKKCQRRDRLLPFILELIND